MALSKSLIFLKKLASNNNRDWFHENRAEYDLAKKEFEVFCGGILDEIKTFEPNFANTPLKKCLLRINRDIRFSADKSPYKKYFGAAFGEGGKNSGKPDYYLHVQPNGETLLGGGFWEATPQQLANFRQELDYNAEGFKKIVQNDSFSRFFNQIWGEKLKKAPKGYAETHPEAEWLKYKQLFFFRKFSDSEVQSADFHEIIVEGCQLLKPYLDFVNEAMSADSN